MPHLSHLDRQGFRTTPATAAPTPAPQTELERAVADLAELDAEIGRMQLRPKARNVGMQLRGEAAAGLRSRAELMAANRKALVEKIAGLRAAAGLPATTPAAAGVPGPAAVLAELLRM
jgi:hypothetical protein